MSMCSRWLRPRVAHRPACRDRHGPGVRLRDRRGGGGDLRARGLADAGAQTFAPDAHVDGDPSALPLLAAWANAMRARSSSPCTHHDDRLRALLVDAVDEAFLASPAEGAERLASQGSGRGCSPSATSRGPGSAPACLLRLGSPRSLARSGPVLVRRRAARGADGTTVVPHAVRPVYVRQPDAVIARERALRPLRIEAAMTRSSSRCCTVRHDRPHGPDARSRRDPRGGRRLVHQPLDARHVRLGSAATRTCARVYVYRSARGEVLAYCAVWLVFDELHINNLAVLPEWRRRGVATELLQHVVDAGGAAGAQSRHARGARLEPRQRGSSTSVRVPAGRAPAGRYYTNPVGGRA